MLGVCNRSQKRLTTDLAHAKNEGSKLCEITYDGVQSIPWESIKSDRRRNGLFFRWA